MYRTYTIITTATDVTTIWHLIDENGLTLQSSAGDEYDFMLDCLDVWGVQIYALPILNVQRVTI